MSRWYICVFTEQRALRALSLVLGKRDDVVEFERPPAQWTRLRIGLLRHQRAVVVFHRHDDFPSGAVYVLANRE